MKDRLTPGQSQRLIELGVDPSKASSQNIYMKQGYGSRGIFQTPIAQPIFDLSDILSFLPKSEKGIGGLVFGFSVEQGRWKAFYDDCPESAKHGEELIDALFELLVWVLENHQESINQD